MASERKQLDLKKVTTGLTTTYEIEHGFRVKMIPNISSNSIRTHFEVLKEKNVNK